MSVWILLAGMVGTAIGAWILNPLWRQDEGRTIFVLALWFLFLIVLVCSIAFYTDYKAAVREAASSQQQLAEHTANEMEQTK